jgi:hypothetical protein
MLSEAWKDMNLIAGIRKVVLGINKKRAGKSSVYLSIPSDVSEFNWQDKNLQKLIRLFLEHVSSASHPGSSIRVSVHEKAGMRDLEKFFSTTPAYWFHFSVQSQAQTGFEKCAREILESLDYHCSEWMGVEDSDSQLGAFHYGTQESISLVLFIENHRSRRICDFLIPVTKSVPFFAHAI